MPLTNEQALVKRETAARAEDVEDLLNHIAWRETILPELQRQKIYYQSLLAASVLGQPVQARLPNGMVQTLTSEQLAGTAYGIDFIQQLMRRIIREGKKALDDLAKNAPHQADT